MAKTVNMHGIEVEPAGRAGHKLLGQPAPGLGEDGDTFADTLVNWTRGGECERCVEQSDAITQNYDAIQAFGFQVIGVHPPGTLAIKTPYRQIEATPADFEAWGVPDGWHGTFIVDGKGVVRMGHVFADPYTNVGALLFQLKELKEEREKEREAFAMRAKAASFRTYEGFGVEKGGG